MLQVNQLVGFGRRIFRAPRIVSSANWHGSSSTTSHSVTLPAGIVAGNLLLMAIGGIPGAGYSASGWTQLTDQTAAAGRRIVILYKIATGSEGPTVTVTASSNSNPAAVVYQLAGWNGAPPTYSTIASATSASPNPASASVASPAFPSLAIAVEAGAATSSATAAPSGYGDLQEAGNSASFATALKELPVGTIAEDPGAFALSASVANGALTCIVQGT